MGSFNTPQFNEVVFNGSSSSSTNTNCWTLQDIRLAARRELLDPASRWWSDAELNEYANDWQNTLQSHFEFVWGTATITSSASTLTLVDDVATDIMRLDAIYYSMGTTTLGTDTSTKRLSPRSVLDLDMMQIDWRNVTTNTGLQPEISYQNDIYTVSFWPPPPCAGTYTFEYPIVLASMTADADVMEVPCWTRFSSTAYLCYKALTRFGPNQNLNKAARYKRRYGMQERKVRKIYDAYLPEKSEMLRPGRRWMGQILIPRQGGAWLG